MKKWIIVLTFLFFQIAYGQSGTAGDPFTALGMAWHVSSSGIYYFAISGDTFSTYVDSGTGWVLVASGSGSTDESSYATTSSLTLQSDEILPSSVYTSTSITAVRMNATAGPNIPFDVESTSSDVLDNLQNDRTLSVNTNSSDWSGTGTSYLQRSCSGNNSSLSTHIYHACGIGTHMHWQVGKNTAHEKVNLSSSSKNDLNLWVRATSVALPIELLYFKAQPTKGENVLLSWACATEVNNELFTVERSIDGKKWENMATVNGSGNSLTNSKYSIIDKSPYQGTNLYRLKQIDFDKKFAYSRVISVEINNIRNPQIKIYPSPANDHVTIEANENELKQISIYNILGENVTGFTKIIDKSQHHTTLDIKNLSSGLYLIKTTTLISKILKW